MEEKPITRSDFIFFRNELLKDIKNLEVRINEKLSTFSKTFENETIVYDEKLNFCKGKIDKISEILDSKNITNKIDEKLENFNKRIEETITTNNTKIQTMEKDIANACFKYDKIFLNYISSPGLIGDGCPFPTMRNFLEFSHKKIKEILSNKEKSANEIRKLSDYIESSIEKFKITINNMKVELSKNIEKIYDSHSKKCDEKINYFDSKIDSLRLENGGYNFGLLKKTEELNEKLQTFFKMNNNIIEIVNKNRNEFNNIKKKFNSFNQLIKTMKLTSGSLALIEEMNKKSSSKKNSKNRPKAENNIDDLLPSIEKLESVNKKNYNTHNCIQDFNIEIINSKASIKPKKKNSFDMNENFVTERFNTNIIVKKDVKSKKNSTACIGNIGNFYILGNKILTDKNPTLKNKINEKYSKTFGDNLITEEKYNENGKQEEPSLNSSNVESNSDHGKNENNENMNEANNYNNIDKIQTEKANKNVKVRTSNTKIETFTELAKKESNNVLRQYSYSSKNRSFADKIIANQKKLEKKNLVNLKKPVKNNENTISSSINSRKNSQNNCKKNFDSIKLYPDDIKIIEAKNNNLIKTDIKIMNEKFENLTKNTNEKLNNMTKQIQNLINEMNKIIFGGFNAKKIKNLNSLIGENNYLYTTSDISIPFKQLNKNSFASSYLEKKQLYKNNMNIYNGPQINNVFMKSKLLKIKDPNDREIACYLRNYKNAGKENKSTEKSKEELNKMSIDEIESYLIKKFTK